MESAPSASAPAPAVGGLTLSQAFSLKVKELLEEHGVSQLELSKRLGLTQPAVSYLLKPRRSRRPHPLDLYQAIVQSFGLELSEVLHEVEARVRTAQGPRRTKAAPSSVVIAPSSYRAVLQNMYEQLGEHLQRPPTAEDAAPRVPRSAPPRKPRKTK